MDFTSYWQLQLISLLPNQVQHLEKPKKFSFKYLVLLCLNVFIIEPDFFAQCIASNLYFLIIGLLLKIFSMQKVLVINIHQLSQLYSQFISLERFEICVILVFKRNLRMVLTIKLKRCVIRVSPFAVIVGKLCYWQNPSFIILLSIYKCRKICFYHSVLLFCLPICLKVEHGGELSLNNKRIIK